MNSLPVLAEVSAALLGFASIVVLFKRRDSGRWRRADADRFGAMLGNAAGAVLFSILPLVFAEYEPSPELLWRICSSLAGTATLVQTVSALRMERRRASWFELWYIGAFGFVAASLQFLNASGLLWSPSAGPYVTGVAWHALQSLVLFMRLVALPAEDVDPSADASA